MSQPVLQGQPAVTDASMDGDRDEVQLRDLETELRLAAHLRALARVSSATAHDVRTPLHTVVLYLELLRNALAGKGEAEMREKQERYVEVIGAEIQRLDRMLDALFGQTRMAEGKRERFDVAATTSDIALFLEPHCRRTRVEIRITPSAAAVPIEGDRDAVRQALFQILIAAVDGLPEGSEIGLNVASADSKATLTLTGCDSERFAILDGSREAPPVRGVPVADRGLAVARRVVERHGGSIKVQPSAKNAPTLELTLPLAAAEIG